VSDTPPRPEYPRPQLVRAEWLNLNGRWEFELDPGCSGEERGLAGELPYSREILVPFCPESPLSGLGLRDFMPCVWYRRRFRVPEAWSGRSLALHCGAVDYDATVWLNGARVGTHRGGYTPFRLDLTPHLRPGDNTLVLRAVDDTRDPLQPSGKQSPGYTSSGCVYTRTTGLWQTVWLEPLPAAHVESVRFYAQLDAGQVILHARLSGDLTGRSLRVRALAAGEPVGQVELPAHRAVTGVVPLAAVRRWCPADPFLYELELELRSGEQTVDRVESYCGLRAVEISGPRILLNGQPLFQRLVLDQGFYPEGVYTAPSDEALRRDIELAQAAGFNGARLHQKVFEPRFLYWADRLGYLVWGEYADWGLDYSHPAALERVLAEWPTVIERDFNHPSIVGWCPFNETPPTQNPELLRTVYRLTKALDPTRPALDTSGHVHVETEVYDCHSYVQDPAAFAALFAAARSGGEVFRTCPEHDAPYRGQPYLCSEYGGIWWNPGAEDDRSWGYGGTEGRPRSVEEFLARHRGLTEALLFHPGLCGFCYTQLYDVEQEVNGLYTYDRRPKFDMALLRAVNTQRAAMEEEG